MKDKILLILISLLQFNCIFSQTYSFKGNNLFSLEYITKDSTQSAIKLLFYDLDSDGDQDVIVTGVDIVDNSGSLSFDKITYFIAVQENIGDRWHPMFKARKPFMNNFPYPNGYFFPAVGDMNHDGKPDFIVSSGVDSFLNLQTLYYERKSLTGEDQFNIIGSDSLQLNNFIAGSFFMPELADMDKDGDLDLLLSGFVAGLDAMGQDIQKPVFMYAKNTGTISQPKYLGWFQNPYGLEASIDQTQMSIVGDIDNDNDNDMLSLTTQDTFKVFAFLKNNVLSNGKPHFLKAIISPFGLPKAGQNESLFPPSLVDIDGDGDLDLFVVQKLKSLGEGIGYYENLICTETLDNTITQTGSILKANLNSVKYQWYDCTTGTEIAGATAQTFQPGKNGKYAVKLDNNSGCENISACFNFIISSTENEVVSNQITIYPNPADDYFTILNNTGSAITGISILNSAGSLVHTVKSGQSDRISTSGLISGNYIIEISSGDWKITKKISIVK